MSDPILTFKWQGTDFAFRMDAFDKGGTEPFVALDWDGPEGRNGHVEVPLADLVVLGRAAQGAAYAWRMTKGLDS